MKNQKKRLVAATQTSDKPYIVRNAAGEEFLLPTYPETFRALMDDKELIRDFLNSILELDYKHEITDLSYEFEKYIDVFMPGDKPMKLDVWVKTRDNRFINIELQNRQHPFFYDRIQLYNAYQILRGKYDYNKSETFLEYSEKEKSTHYYEIPETVSIWLCNFNILKQKNIYKDVWTVYSENDIKGKNARPIFPKNKYIIVDLPKFAKLRRNIQSHEDFWLKLLRKGPLEVVGTRDSLLTKALERLRVSNVKPKFLKNMEKTMFDTNADRAILADEMLKAEAKAMRRGMKRGLEKGMEKGMEEGLQKGMEKGLAQGMEKGMEEGLQKGLQKGMEKGAKQERAKIVARDKKIEEFLRSKGVSPELLTAALAIK